MTEDEIVNELYDQIESTFELECDKCCEVFQEYTSDKESAADKFFENGFTFKKFKPDEIGGKIICGKCR